MANEPYERLARASTWTAPAPRRWETRPGPATGTDVMRRLGGLVEDPRRMAGVRRLLLAMVVLDSAATYLWVSTGIAVEGNPLVAGLMATLGDGPALTVRALWSAALVVLLCAIARRRPTIRPAVTLVAGVLGAVTLLHLGLLVWSWSTLTA